jgi:hypothetical protein
MSHTSLLERPPWTGQIEEPRQTVRTRSESTLPLPPHTQLIPNDTYGDLNISALNNIYSNNQNQMSIRYRTLNYFLIISREDMSEMGEMSEMSVSPTFAST